MAEYGIWPKLWERLADLEAKNDVEVNAVGQLHDGLLIEFERRGIRKRLHVVVGPGNRLLHVQHLCEASAKHTPCFHLALGAEIAEKVGFIHRIDRAHFYPLAHMGGSAGALTSADVVRDLTLDCCGHPADWTHGALVEEVHLGGEGRGRWSRSTGSAPTPAPRTVPAPATSSDSGPASEPMPDEELSFDVGEGARASGDDAALPDGSTSEEREVVTYLQGQGVSAGLIRWVLQFRSRADVLDEDRIRKPQTLYYGPQAVQVAIAALSLSKNLALVGPKSTGKNVLCATLSWALHMPLFEFSSHVGVEAADLTADKTLGVDGEGRTTVEYETGALVRAMQRGWLFDADEMNILRPEVASILHGLDWRRRIEVPGHGTVVARDDFRLIATMNHGYAGTVEPSEALFDRFVVLQMQPLDEADLVQIIKSESRLRDERKIRVIARVYLELRKKAEHHELDDTRAISVRGAIDAADLVAAGVPVFLAVTTTMTNKVLDEHYRKLVEDTVSAIAEGV